MAGTSTERNPQDCLPENMDRPVLPAVRRTWLLERLKLGRIEFAGFLFCVMMYGALSLHGSALQVTEVIVLLVVALFSNLSGSAHNDYCEVQIDRHAASLSGRPLVSEVVSITSARVMIICCVAGNTNALSRVMDAL